MWIIACFLVVGAVRGNERAGPLVETKLGSIKGLHSDDGDYFMFLGIPYGKVNKSNPFGVASPYPEFKETFQAFDDTVKCPQVEEFNNTIVGTLDCLNLNIYVPRSASCTSKFPVLVWIYGGGFNFGFAGRYLYGPKYLIRHHVILVTLNYRLGPYGFMCLDTPEVPGNQGQKDQLLALRWINNNIESFGGDFNKVTLGGQSAGAGSVDAHLWSKQEKLFNQIILQSGSIFGPWAFTESNYTQPLILAKHLGYDTEDLSEALSFLAKTDVRVVIAAETDLSMKFQLCVEKEFKNVERFIIDYPRNLKVPKAKTSRILIGHNSLESTGTLIKKPESDFKNMNIFNISLSQIFNYDENFIEMEELLRHFYIGDNEISKAVQWNLINFLSDHNYIYPTQKSIQTYLDNGAHQIYYYVFSYSGERNLMKKKYNITANGAIHADELSYIFDMIYDPSTPTKDDQRVIDMTTALWTNFIKYGDPTPKTTELLSIKWLSATKEALNYLNINLKLSQGKRPFNDRIAFWELFVKANKDKLKGYKHLKLVCIIKPQSLVSKKWKIACFLILGVVRGNERANPQVETKLGIVKGLYSDEGDYYMFLGIPYGKVNKSNAFGVASPYPEFKEPFLALDDTVKCPQVEEFNNTIVGTLDCLHLNIYVPRIASSISKLPVLVWIYGGGFHYGFAGRYIYGPKYIVKQDVIFVTLNYRLGPYGFMCLDTSEVPGNQGLKDQLLALRWINNNIASFGGDVNKITLGGESAGASSVDAHLWSKQEKLFNQVILQSGSIFVPWTFTESNYKQPLILAKHLGFDTEDLSEALLFLTKADVKVVIAAVTNLSMRFKLCVEKEFENVERFIIDYPRNENVPKAKNSRILIGHTSQESMGSLINKTESDFKNMNIFNISLNQIFNYDENFIGMEELVRHFYIGDNEISKAVQWNLIDFLSDHYFIYPLHNSIQKYLDNGAQQVYYYVFSYSGERNLMKKKDNITAEGAIHADELSYIFDMTYDPSTPTEDDQRVIDMTTALWTNFVKHGDPTPVTTELLPIKWMPVTKEALNYLNINLTLFQGKGPFNDRIAFWKLFVKANKDKLKGYKHLE